jgi:hypothetical protein
MPTRVFVRPWRNDTAASSFPFASTLQAVSDTELPFPVAAVLDASIYASPQSPFYLTEIELDVSGDAVIWVGTEADTRIASTSVSPGDTDDVLTLMDGYDRKFGVLVVDPTQMQIVTAWSLGIHSFGTSLEFVASVMLPSALAVEGVLLDDGTLLSDDVWIVGEDGVVVRSVGGVLRVDIVGDPMFRRRLCTPPGAFTVPRFVKTISGQSADDYRHFTISAGTGLAADSILRIVPDQDQGAIWIGLVGQTVENEDQ